MLFQPITFSTNAHWLKYVQIPASAFQGEITNTKSDDRYEVRVLPASLGMKEATSCGRRLCIMQANNNTAVLTEYFACIAVAADRRPTHLTIRPSHHEYQSAEVDDPAHQSDVQIPAECMCLGASPFWCILPSNGVFDCLHRNPASKCGSMNR